jgi:hypothetical protein
MNLYQLAKLFEKIKKGLSALYLYSMQVLLLNTDHCIGLVAKHCFR